MDSFLRDAIAYLFLAVLLSFLTFIVIKSRTGKKENKNPLNEKK